MVDLMIIVSRISKYTNSSNTHLLFSMCPVTRSRWISQTMLNAHGYLIVCVTLVRGSVKCAVINLRAQELKFQIRRYVEK